MSAQGNTVNNMPSVWQVMNYQVPRGRCDKKEGLFSTCSCKRFMQHPMHAAASFNCDGCKHHASFHKMKNEVDDAVYRESSELANAQAEETQQAGEPSRKRPRALLFEANDEQLRNQNLNDMISGRAGKERNAPTSKAGSSKAPPNAPTGPSAAGPSKAPASRAAVTRAKSKTNSETSFQFSEDANGRIEELN